MNKETHKTILTKCWGDPDFKQRLIADPVETLRTEGVCVPEGVKVTVVENTATEFTFVIPLDTSELSDEALDDVSGGAESRLPVPLGKNSLQMYYPMTTF